MPNKKLTDAEVKKAVECCSEPYCNDNQCPLHKNTINTKDCITQLSTNALDLINRLEGENKKNENIIRIADKTIATLQAENESLKAEVERLKKVEERHMRLYHLLLDPVIVANGKNGELRPIKRTSRQDVYHTLLRAQEIMKIPHRWFPWKRDGDNK